jgi:hypothetical protein
MALKKMQAIRTSVGQENLELAASTVKYYDGCSRRLDNGIVKLALNQLHTHAFRRE